MVSLWRGNRRGASNMGCLLSLLFFAGALYYGIHIGELYWRFYQVQAEMASQARLAPSLTDDVIRRRLVEVTDNLGLPREASRFKIRRGGRPARITIESQYSEELDLPLVRRTFVFRPRAEERL
jgi:hypothetical protein